MIIINIKKIFFYDSNNNKKYSFYTVKINTIVKSLRHIDKRGLYFKLKYAIKIKWKINKMVHIGIGTKR